MKYKGYEARIEYEEEDRLFFGRVIGIKDIIVFDGLSVDELEQAFHDIIDRYLADCQALNKIPEEPKIMNNRILEKIKLGIDAISLLQLRAKEFKKELNFFYENRNESDLNVRQGLRRLEQEVMFLAIDTYSLHEGISKRQSLYSKVIKENGRFFSRVDTTPSVDENTLIVLMIDENSNKPREATVEEIDNSCKLINKDLLERKTRLRDEFGIKSSNHEYLDEWCSRIVEKELIDKLGSYRNNFAHRFDKLQKIEELRKSISPNPDAIGEILNTVSLVLEQYKKRFKTIVLYTESIQYEGYSRDIYLLSTMSKIELLKKVKSS